MIEGMIKETVTDGNKVYKYTTVCDSGTRANVTVIRPVLTNEEYTCRKKLVERELISFAKGIIADGFNWEELVHSTSHNKEDKNADV